MDKYKYFVLGFIAGVLVACGILYFATQGVKKAEGTYVPKFYVCHVENPDEGGVNQQTLHLPFPGYLAHLLQHDADYAGECEEPEEEVCEDETALNYGEEGECEYPKPSCEETQTCEERETPPSPFNDGGSSNPGATQAPTCSDSVPGKVANIFVATGTPNDGKLEVKWLSDEPKGNKAHIRYTEGNGENWQHALLNTDNDGNEVIGELKNGVHYNFQVAQVNGCAVGPWSKTYDPLP